MTERTLDAALRHGYECAEHGACSYCPTDCKSVHHAARPVSDKAEAGLREALTKAVAKYADDLCASGGETRDAVIRTIVRAVAAHPVSDKAEAGDAGETHRTLLEAANQLAFMRSVIASGESFSTEDDLHYLDVKGRLADLERSHFAALATTTTAPATEPSGERRDAEGALLAFIGGALTGYDAETRAAMLDRAEHYIARIRAATEPSGEEGPCPRCGGRTTHWQGYPEGWTCNPAQVAAHRSMTARATETPND